MEHIIQYLHQNPNSDNSEIRRGLRRMGLTFSKQDLNRTLYWMRGEGRVDYTNTDPRRKSWFITEPNMNILVGNNPTPPNEPNMNILVGNNPTPPNEPNMNILVGSIRIERT